MSRAARDGVAGEPGAGDEQGAAIRDATPGTRARVDPERPRGRIVADDGVEQAESPRIVDPPTFGGGPARHGQAGDLHHGPFGHGEDAEAGRRRETASGQCQRRSARPRNHRMARQDRQRTGQGDRPGHPVGEGDRVRLRVRGTIGLLDRCPQGTGACIEQARDPERRRHDPTLQVLDRVASRRHRPPRPIPPATAPTVRGRKDGQETTQCAENGPSPATSGYLPNH